MQDRELIIRERLVKLNKKTINVRLIWCQLYNTIPGTLAFKYCIEACCIPTQLNYYRAFLKYLKYTSLPECSDKLLVRHDIFTLTTSSTNPRIISPDLTRRFF